MDLRTLHITVTDELTQKERFHSNVILTLSQRYSNVILPYATGKTRKETFIDETSRRYTHQDDSKTVTMCGSMLGI